MFFYDLGSGIGKALVAASLLGNFEKIVGVEILDDVFAASQDVITSYKNNVRENVCKNIEIIHGDIRNVAIDKADLVYVASTCFDESFMLHLSKKAETMKKGAQFITLTRPLKSDALKLINKESMPMSWGSTTIFIFERM